MLSLQILSQGLGKQQQCPFTVFSHAKLWYHVEFLALVEILKKIADQLKQITSAVKQHSSHQHNGHEFFTRETFKGQKPQKALVAHLVNDDLGNSSKSSSNPNLG